MTPEQLKASILQMAIQGKLVEQREEEGTAEELLENISEKKKQLIKNKIIKATKPLEVIDNNDFPFDLPISWKWVKWGDVVNIVSARRVHQSDWQKEGVPFYRAREIAAMSRTGEPISNELFISEELFAEFSKSGVPQTGDIMVTAVGTLGKTYIVKETDKFYYKDASVICFENRYGLCPEYLAMLMETPLMKQQIKSNSEGTTVATLTMVRMVEYIIPLPPIDEQRRIVAKIEELQPYVDRYAASWKKLEHFNAKFPEDMRKSILQYAIQGKLVEQRPEEGTAEELYQQIQAEKQKLIKEGKIKKEKPLVEITEDEIPYEIPERWKWVKLGTLFHIERGSSPRPIKDYLTKSEDGVNWIKIGDSEVGAKYITTTSEKITLQGAQKSRKVEIGDFIISNSMSFGRPYIMAIDGYVHDGWNIIHFISDEDGNDLLYKDYIYYILSSNLLKQQIIERAAGGVVQNIRSDNLKELIVPVPPLKEQHRIVSKIEELLPYCDRLVKK
jgi:type I restriction enzyme S subunit